MVLFIYLLLAIASFATLITVIIGLVSASTPVLLGILVIGLIVTQKLMTKFAQPDIEILEATNIQVEKNIELTLNQTKTTIKDIKKNSKKLLTYRGFNYQKKRKRDTSSLPKSLTQIKYRGLNTVISKRLNS